MGLFDQLFDSDWQQRNDIDDLKDRLDAASNRQATRGADLRRQVAELELLCRGLMTCLQEKGLLDLAALFNVMERLDSEDGVLDGRITPPGERPYRAHPAKPAARPAPEPPPPPPPEPSGPGSTIEF